MRTPESSSRTNRENFLRFRGEGPPEGNPGSGRRERLTPSSLALDAHMFGAARCLASRSLSYFADATPRDYWPNVPRAIGIVRPRWRATEPPLALHVVPAPANSEEPASRGKPRTPALATSSNVYLAKAQSAFHHRGRIEAGRCPISERCDPLRMRLVC